MRRLIADIKTLETRSTLALILTAFVLIAVQFRASAGYWIKTPFLRERFQSPDELQFASQIAWAASTVVLFGVVPFLFAWLGLRMKPSEFGFRLKGFLRHLPVYVVFFLFILPMIYWAAERPDFLRTYPFATLAGVADPEVPWWRDRHFLIWELAYLLQFCALEMFFRGFLVFSLERRFGLGSVAVMAIPYAMIHLHKPMPEAFGAIFAGLILGYMALRTRSFYGGILLHYAVALTMDLLARSR